MRPLHHITLTHLLTTTKTCLWHVRSCDINIRITQEQSKLASLDMANRLRSDWSIAKSFGYIPQHSTSCCSRSSHLYHLCTLNVGCSGIKQQRLASRYDFLSPLHSPTLWLSDSACLKLCLSLFGYLLFAVHATTKTDRLKINRHVAFVGEWGVSKEQHASGVTCMARSGGFDTLNRAQSDSESGEEALFCIWCDIDLPNWFQGDAGWRFKLKRKQEYTWIYYEFIY